MPHWTVMHLMLSIAVIGATVFGTEWPVGNWLGEDRRFRDGLGGVALLLLAGALVKASGVNGLTRFCASRSSVPGSGRLCAGRACGRDGCEEVCT